MFNWITKLLHQPKPRRVLTPVDRVVEPFAPPVIASTVEGRIMDGVLYKADHRCLFRKIKFADNRHVYKCPHCGSFYGKTHAGNWRHLDSR